MVHSQKHRTYLPLLPGDAPARTEALRRKAGLPAGAKDKKPRKRKAKNPLVSEAEPMIPRTEKGPQGNLPDQNQPKLPIFEVDDAPTVSGETIADEVFASGGEASHASPLYEDAEEDPKSVEEARNQRACPKWEVAM